MQATSPDSFITAADGATQSPASAIPTADANVLGPSVASNGVTSSGAAGRGSAAAKRAAGDRVDYLDGWRGISLLLVILGHFFPNLVGEQAGEIGVDLFFALSGRLMCEILFERRADLKLFFTRRFSRVYPGLLFFVIAAAILFSQTDIRIGLLGMASALTFTINYAMIYFHHTGLFDHLWSLCVEEHSYVILGAIAFVFRRQGWDATWFILALGFAALANGIIQHDILGHSHFDVFWRTDVKIAAIFLSGGLFLALKAAPARIKLWLGLACLPLAVCSRIYGQSSLWDFGLWTIAVSVLIATLDSSPRPVRALLSWSPLRQAGIWSYSLYLWQQPFYKFVGAAPIWALLLGAIVTGLFSFYVIEKPARTLINNRMTALLRPRSMPA